MSSPQTQGLYCSLLLALFTLWMWRSVYCIITVETSHGVISPQRASMRALPPWSSSLTRSCLHRFAFCHSRSECSTGCILMYFHFLKIPLRHAPPVSFHTFTAPSIASRCVDVSQCTCAHLEGHLQTKPLLSHVQGFVTIEVFIL